MKSLFDYIQENEGGAFSTPSNTMGMGNPGVLPDGSLTEPIVTAKCKKEKLKKKKVSESILDDEDELISNTIKNTKNPFYFVSTLINNKDLLIRHKQEIEKLFGEFIKTIKSKSPIEIITDPVGIKLKHRYHYAYDPLIILRPGDLWSKNDDMYGFSDDKQLVIFFTEPFMEDYISYGFKNERYYRDWIRTIAKKYNLKQSKKDEFVYYI